MNLNDKKYKFFPKEGTDKPVNQMPLLIAEGRTPLSVAGLMQRRLEVLAEGTPENVRDAWWNNYFFTEDLAAYHPDGRFKIVLDSDIVRALSSETPLYQGAIKFGTTAEEANAVYEHLQGQEFSRENLEATLNRNLSRKEAKKSGIWLALAQGNQTLLNDYADAVFDRAKNGFDDYENMAIYLAGAPEIASGRLWIVYILYGVSSAGGSNDADDNFGRLVGVLPDLKCENS